MDLRRAARYMGCPQMDQQTLALLEKAAPLTEAAAQPRHRILRLKKSAFPLPGREVEALLNGCDEIILLAATLGVGMDACIRSASVMDMALGLAVNACAASLLEDYLNTLALPLGDGEYATPRFSPGYGDLPLETQPLFLEKLQSHLIGLHETRAHMLAPEKSVTALCGVTAIPQKQCLRHCCRCPNTACPFREA